MLYKAIINEDDETGEILIDAKSDIEAIRVILKYNLGLNRKLIKPGIMLTEVNILDYYRNCMYDDFTKHSHFYKEIGNSIQLIDLIKYVKEESK